MNNNDFTHNEFTKSAYLSNTNEYSIRVNSRDRNIEKERNPFNFKIKFNKWDTKYTNYYKSDWWNTSSSKLLSNTVQVNNGATIPDSVENIKELKISEIVAPRFIPSDKIGKLIENVTATCHDNATNRIFFKTSDDTNVEYYINGTIPFYKITDFNQNTCYLFKTANVASLTTDFKKTYGLLERYYTDTLLLDGTIYKISDIADGYIQLDKNTTFIESEIYLPKYYTNDVWYDTDAAANSKISHTTTSINLNESGHLFNHNFTKDSILEINGSDYFKIDTVRFSYNFKDALGNSTRREDKTYPNNIFSNDDVDTIKSGLNSSPQVEVDTQFVGTWLTTYPPTINDGGINRILHLKEGMKDLLNDKLFYLSLEPITPDKNLITNGKLNNVIGTLYPSTQSRNYIYLVGKNVGQKFTFRNLQNIKDLTFCLFNKDGTKVGTVYDKYSIDYLEKDCRQTSINFNVESIDRSFN